MYVPPHFEETDPAAVQDIITSCPLATLVAQTASGLVANHIPVIADGPAALIGHVAAANDLHRMLTDQTEILLVFKGQDSYVSPNWYPTKPRHHRHVPTWNYQVVHIHGRIVFVRDEKSKRAIVGRLTKHFETETNGEKAWKMADAPADFMADMLQNIVAFRIQIDLVSAKTKLSQNRELEDYDNVTREFESRGLIRLSSRMRALRSGQKPDAE